MVVYEIVGGVVVLALIALGILKFTEIMNRKKGRSK